jgi:hypothetical protein
VVLVRGARAHPGSGFLIQKKIKLLLVAAVCVAPFAAGWILYLSDWRPAATSNYGELIPPRPLAGAPFDGLRGKWVLVTFDAAACDAYCEKKLYFMRQVRRTQGKEMERIERLWAVTDGGKPRPEVVAAIEGTRIVSFNDKSFSSDFIYLVDPLGNLMLRFPRDPDPSRMVKDLKQLLKYSRVG